MLSLGLGITAVRGGGGPEQILGTALLGYWDAERIDKLTLSGSSVTTWTDAVGSYAATQAVGASKPVYSATSFNGRPGVTFDGSDDELTLGSVPFPTAASACEFWILVDQQALAADATTRRAFAYGGTTSNNDARQLARGQGTGISLANALGGTGAANVSAAAVTSTDFAGRHVARAVFDGTNLRCDIDGITGSNAALVPGTASTRTRIGASAFGVGFWQGQIAAILVTSLLSADQAAQLLTYLKARGGIA